jgi:copper transport protein
VISVDSHPVSGAVVFSIGDASGRVGDRLVSTPERTTLATVAAFRALFVAALLLAAGGVLAQWRVADFSPDVVRHNRRLVAIASAAAFALGAILLGVTGCYLSGIPLTGLFTSTPWRVALTSSLAQSLAVAATGLVLLLVALPRLGQRGNRVTAIAGSLIALTSFAFTGHAATTAPQPLMRWAVPLHALAAAFWLGSLPVLVASLKADQPGRALLIVRRFSAHAVVAVALLLVLGFIIAVVQLGHLDMLWQTTYGRLLIAKLASVALLLGIAIDNRWRLTPLLPTDAAAAARLRRAIAIDYVLFAIVLGLTAALGQIEPPRTRVARDAAAVTHGAADFSISVTQGTYRITLSVSPAIAGHNALAVQVTDANGVRIVAQEVVLDLSLPAAGVEPIRRSAEGDGTGLFIHHGNELALAGRWHVEVHALIDDFTKVIVPFDVPIR